MSGFGIFCAALHITVFDQTGSSLPLCLLGERTVKIPQKISKQLILSKLILGFLVFELFSFVLHVKLDDFSTMDISVSCD